MKKITRVVVIISLLFLSQQSIAQSGNSAHSGGHKHNHTPGIGTEAMLNVPIEKTSVAKPYLEYMGKIDQNAQYYFWQAMGYYYGFAWLDAARSLKMALKIEPNFPAARTLLVINLIQLNNKPEIYAHLQGALDPNDTSLAIPKFKEFAEVLRAQLQATVQGNRKVWFDALYRFVERYPDDVNAAALLAYNFYQQIGGIDAGKQVLKNVIQSTGGEHFGAHHYLTHLAESSADYELAFKHGQEFAKRAEIIPHGWHMAGHIAGRMPKDENGGWKGAIYFFEKAHELHMKWAKDYNAKPEADWHYQHNLHLMSVAYFADHKPAKAAMYAKMACDLGASGESDCFNYADMLINQQKYAEADLFLRQMQNDGMNSGNQGKNLRAQIMRAEIALITGKFKSVQDLVTTVDMAGIQKTRDGNVVRRYNRMVVLASVLFAPPAQKTAAIKNLLEQDFGRYFAAAGFDTWANAFLVAENYNIYLQKACEAEAAAKIIKLVQKHIDSDYRSKNTSVACGLSAQ